MPWYNGPLARESKEKYQEGVFMSQSFLLLGLAARLGFYLLWAVGTVQVESDEGKEQGVCGFVPSELYVHLFIGPWIVKDLFWTLDLAMPCLAFGLMTLTLVADALRRFGGDALRTEVLWILGNLVWSVSELWLVDTVRWPRVLAAALLTLGG